MIFTSQRVPASGPKTAQLAVIGMAPAKNEVAERTPFVGFSGRIFNDALAACKVNRANVYVTNLCEFFIDDNNLYSVPEDLLEQERRRVFSEIDEVKPNCLLILGTQTLVLLMEGFIGNIEMVKGKLRPNAQQKKVLSKWAITKWRGSIIQLTTPSGRIQKCVVGMHPAGFARGQWKWLPVFKYCDVPRAVTQSTFPDMKLSPRSMIVGPSFRSACEYLREANEKEWTCFDYEGRSHITCLGIGWTTSEAMCIPLNRVGASSYWSVEEEMEIWRLWSQVMQNGKKKIAQNASFEWIKSWLYGIYPSDLGIDTMHLHHCLYPDFGGVSDEWTARKRDIANPGHGLAFITSFYTDIPYYKDDGRHWTPELGEEKFWQYNCLDVMATMESAKKMASEAVERGLWKTYEKLYLDTFENALRIEWEGIAIDEGRRTAARLESEARLAEWKANLSTATGLNIITKASGKPLSGTLNLGSPQQMLNWLTKVKKYKVRVNRATGAPTVDKDTLEMLAIQHNDPVLREMMRMNREQDLINNWLTAPLLKGRMHCHVKQGGTNGTRWSTAESILGTGRNLQNLDREGIVRSLFLPS